VVLLDYGLTPEYVNRRWTEELLSLIFISRARRSKRQADMADGKYDNLPLAGFELVSEAELFRQAGIQPEVVQRGGRTGN
jgi:hypothetical protein